MWMCLLTIAVVLLFVGGVGAIEIETGRNTGLGGAVLLSESSASALLLVPSGGIEPGEAKVEIIAIRRF